MTTELGFTDPTGARVLRRVVIKEELVALTGGYIEALVLNQFLYWEARRRDYTRFLAEEVERAKKAEAAGAVPAGAAEYLNGLDLGHGWIYKTAEELAVELMIGKSPQTLRRYIARVVEQGLVAERRNPYHAWDRCYQYRVNLIKVQVELAKIGAVLDGWPLLGVPTFSILENGTTILEFRFSGMEEQYQRVLTQSTQKGAGIVSLEDWLERVQAPETGLDALVDMALALYPRVLGTDDTDKLEIGVAVAANRVGGRDKLARLLWDRRDQPEHGDPIAAIVQEDSQAKLGQSPRRRRQKRPSLRQSGAKPKEGTKATEPSPESLPESGPPEIPEHATIWVPALEELGLQMTKATFNTWLRGTRLIAWDNPDPTAGVCGAATVLARDGYGKDWLENRLRAPIERTLAGLADGAVALLVEAPIACSE